MGPSFQINGSPAVIGVLATAGVVKSMLSSLINRAGDEVRSTLQEALQEITVLESKLMNDLEGLEKATMEDLDKITQDRLSEFNSMLESVKALVLQLEQDINADLAIRMKASIAEANATWSLISQDINQKIQKTTKGIFYVIDDASIQILKIIFVICSFVLIIAGIFILRKNKKVGITALVFGTVILIFSLTPFFRIATSNLSLFKDKIEENGSFPDPFILSTFPDALSFSYNEQANINIFGVNFVGDSTPSQLFYGKTVSNLKPISQASINNTVIQFPSSLFTGSSGKYYLQVVRGDNKKSQIINAYVTEPELIPIKINYVIWQIGIFSTYSVQELQVRDVHRCGYWDSYIKDFHHGFSDNNWKVQDFSKESINDRYLSDLNEYTNSGNFSVDFNLKCHPFNQAGWYRANYFLNSKMESSGDTRPMANSGVLILYFNPETQKYSMLSYINNNGFELYQISKKMIIDMKPVDKARLKERRLVYLKPTISSIINFNDFAVSQGPILPGMSYQEFTLGQTPVVPGFTSDRTRYNVIVTSSNVNSEVIDQEGSSSIRNLQARIFMQLHLVNNSLVATMLRAPN
jgi:hypothetical protein